MQELEGEGTQGFDLEALEAEAAKGLGLTPEKERETPPDVDDYIQRLTKAEDDGPVPVEAETNSDEAEAKPVEPDMESPEAEIERLRKQNSDLQHRLGKQGTERGLFTEELHRLRTELDEMKQAQTKRLEDFSDEEIAMRTYEYDESRFKGELGDHYREMGRGAKNILALVFEQSENLRAEMNQMRSELAFEAAATSAGLSDPAVRQQLLQKYPVLAQESDPGRRLDMMRKLAEGDGLAKAPQPTQTPAQPTAPGRNPATHVAGSGRSAGSTVPQHNNLYEAIQEDIRNVNPMDDEGLLRIGRTLEEEVEGKDLGLGLRQLLKPPRAISRRT